MLEYNSVSFALTAACVVLLLIELIYFCGTYSRVYKACRKKNPDQPDTDCPPISVILVTKDSGEALKKNLPVILEQDYPFFEVIVVNDESVGEDEDTLKILEKKYSNLYHTFIPKSARYISRQKLGISMGLKASKYKWIVVTDPYSCPVSKNWLRCLSKHFTSETEIVLGYSNYTSNNTPFARHVITDTIMQSMRYLGRALGGNAYMGIGHNMAYRKDTYELHKGFSNQLNLKRGEDDLFVNSVANERNTKVALEPDSFVRMSIPPYKRIWKEEKTSYDVTGKFYKGCSRILNSIETLACTFFHLAVAGGLTMSIIEKQWILAGVIGLCWLLRFIVVNSVFIKTANALGENIRFYFPAYDLCRPWYSYRAKMRYLLRTKSDYVRR